MNILALDLSLTATGWAMWRPPLTENGHIAGSRFREDPVDPVRTSGVILAPKGLREGVRLLWYWRKLQEFLGGSAEDLRPTMVVIEDHVVRTPAAGGIAQLHGTIKAFAAAEAWPTPILVPPASLKKYATGKGNADKIQMVLAASKRLGYDGSNDNEADALWLLEIGRRLAKEPCTDVPAAHLEAMAKITVPL